MALPDEFYTVAVPSATYIAARQAYPDSPIILNDKTFEIKDKKQITLPSLEELTVNLEAQGRHQLHIGPYQEGSYLDINADGSFRISNGHSEQHYDELTEQQRTTEKALRKTGFTPTRGFNLFNRLILKGYKHLFSESWGSYRESLIKRYSSQVDGIEALREVPVEEVSCRYLDTLTEREDTILTVPKSVALRLGKLGVGTAAAVGAYLLAPEHFNELGTEIGKCFSEYGPKVGIATKMITNSVFITTGDVLGRWLNGNEFDLRRTLTIALWGLAYGAQYEAVCQGLDFIPNEEVSGKLLRTGGDMVGYSNLFAIEHMLATRNHKGKTPGAIAKQLAKVQAYVAAYWGPIQFYNQNFALPDNKLLNMNLAFLPWVIFLGIVFSENKELDDVKGVVSRLK